VEVVSARPEWTLNATQLRAELAVRTGVRRTEDLVAAVEAAVVRGWVSVEKRGVSKLYAPGDPDAEGAFRWATGGVDRVGHL
jgi:hypothetical protein